jgi:hypothetical protein
LVKHHQTNVDMFYLIYIASVIAIGMTILSLQIHFTRHENAYLFYALTLFSYMFLHFYNFVPFIENVWDKNNPIKHQLSFILILTIVFGSIVMHINYKFGTQL